jgi:hypothetical protein
LKKQHGVNNKLFFVNKKYNHLLFVQKFIFVSDVFFFVKSMYKKKKRRRKKKRKGKRRWVYGNNGIAAFFAGADDRGRVRQDGQRGATQHLALPHQDQKKNEMKNKEITNLP